MSGSCELQLRPAMFDDLPDIYSTLPSVYLFTHLHFAQSSIIQCQELLIHSDVSAKLEDFFQPFLRVPAQAIWPNQSNLMSTISSSACSMIRLRLPTAACFLSCSATLNPGWPLSASGAPSFTRSPLPIHWRSWQVWHDAIYAGLC